MTNRLLTHGDCIAAFVELAQACGLSPLEDLSGIRREVELGACGSLVTAKRIIEQTVPTDSDRIWERLVAEVEAYQQARKLRHCRGINPEPNTIDCSGMAPVVMDLLLQLLEPHFKDNPAR